MNGADDFRAIRERDLAAYGQAVAEGRKNAPGMLLLYGANPLYALPPTAGMPSLFDNPDVFKVALTEFLDESAVRCDLVLPAAVGLERFDDVYTPYGYGEINYGIANPVTPPLYQSRPIAEVLIALAQELKLDLGVAAMPELLWKRGASLNANIRAMLNTGQVTLARGQRAFSTPVYNVADMRLAAGSAPAANGSDTLQLAPVAVLGMGTAQTGIPPFATKIITDYQLKGSYSVAQINAATASRLRVRNGDYLKLTGENGTTVVVMVSLFEGVPPDVVALCAGLGHTAFDEFSQNKGVNIMTLTGVSHEPGTGLSVWGTANLKAVKA